MTPWHTDMNGADASTPRSLHKRYTLLAALVFCTSLVMFTINNTTQVLRIDGSMRLPLWYQLHRNLTERDKERLAVSTPGCSIPAMQPFSEEIRPLVSFPDKMQPCPDSKHPLLRNNKTHIWVELQYLEHYNVTNLTCCYRSFYRPNDVKDITASTIDSRVRYDECVYFSSSIGVNHEFVNVYCNFNNNKVYEQYFLFALKKPLKLYDDAKPAPRNKSSYNVLVIGIDNVSRLNFHRTMPKTLQLIMKLGAVELVGYNKVADNSYPNLVAMLMGHSQQEVGQVCHPFARSVFDECPFVWHAYKARGYYTCVAEDSAALGTFNYALAGFMRSPADYYTHTFMEQARRVGAVHDFNADLCMHNTHFYRVLLDYADNLTDTLKDSRLFGFFWEVTMSHDYANYPMIMDDSYVEFFKRLAGRKYLDESIVLLVSDHGIRWGPIRSTAQGKWEERLPFVYVLTPQSFRDHFPDAYNNLKLNSRRLSTPFDVHETLVDLVDLDNIRDDQIRARLQTSYATRRGISLLLPIPSNRTCATAAIPDHWCACRRTKPLATRSEVARAAAASLMEQVNDMLQGHAACARLRVDEIVQAGRVETGGAREVVVTVRAQPGRGLLEGTLQEGQGGGWALQGAPSRLNLYGNQSHCVREPQLKLYCFCV